MKKFVLFFLTMFTVVAIAYASSNDKLSKTDIAFLSKVKGMEITMEDGSIGVFSEDGKELILGEEGSASFVNAISETKGVYYFVEDGDTYTFGVLVDGGSLSLVEAN